MSISKFAVKRPTMILIIFMLLAALGIYCTVTLPVDMYPDMDIPYILVYTNYSNAGPEEVETKVTKPLESALASVSGIETIASSSAAGSSIVMLTFEFGTDLAEATNYVRDSVEMAKMMMPTMMTMII